MQKGVKWVNPGVSGGCKSCRQMHIMSCTVYTVNARQGRGLFKFSAQGKKFHGSWSPKGKMKGVGRRPPIQTLGFLPLCKEGRGRKRGGKRLENLPHDTWYHSSFTLMILLKPHYNVGGASTEQGKGLREAEFPAQGHVAGNGGTGA